MIYTHSAWMMANDLCDYKEHKEKYSLPKKIKGFSEAIWEIEEDPDLIITLGKPPKKKKRQTHDKYDQVHVIIYNNDHIM